LLNFDVNIVWNYGWKHFFGFNDLSNSDDVLFIGIVRNLEDWINSLYREKHHLPNTLTSNVNSFLTNPVYSFYNDKNHKITDKEIMEDRNIDTKERYKNIFELRLVKNRFLVEKMPKLVKNYCLITYDELRCNFSDIMRKAFHHETISISRETDDKFIEVRHPQLSLVISGTPNQVKPLINSNENGLFSRFIFYVFDDVMGWKDVSPKGITIDYNALFSNVSDEISNLYQKLQDNVSNVEIMLSDSQWEQFNKDMSYVTELLINQNRSDVLSIIKRQGLIFFRICMILTIIRNKDLETFPDKIVCDDADYLIAFEIMKIIIDHSLHASNLIQNGKIELTVRETQFLAQMSKNFTRADAVAYAEQINIPTRTLDYMLKKLTENSFLSKISNGVYEKKA
jgi:hypothetical protein